METSVNLIFLKIFLLVVSIKIENVINFEEKAGSGVHPLREKYTLKTLIKGI